MGNNHLFLPVNLVIQKSIKKQFGDMVHLKLFIDKSTLQIPREIILCFENEPKKAFDNFRCFTETHQKAYLDWIYLAKTEEKKAERILKLMDSLLKAK